VIRTQSELHVAASPEVVFDRLVDMRNDLHWNPIAVEMRKTTEGEIGDGTRFEGKMKRVGPMHMVVTQFDRPRAFKSSGGSRGADVDYSASFEPVDGGTRIRTELQMEPKGIAKLFAPLMARQVPKQEEESMQSFKRWVESSGSAEPS
jgi:Polyketide cyclase / dehydrase and lipid transport